MDELKLYMVSFNCGRSLIESTVFAAHLFDGWQDPSSSLPSLPDVIVLHLQEIAPLAYAFLGNSFVSPYLHLFRTALRIASHKYSETHEVDGVDYFNIAVHNCGLTGLMVFTKDDLTSKVQSLNIAEVGVGVAEMGNKGAVGARLGWQLDGSTDLLYLTFVSAHLAPFEQEVEQRNRDYTNIAKSLVFDKQSGRKEIPGNKAGENVPLLGSDRQPVNDGPEAATGIYSDDSYLFVGGDLNYRTGLTGPTGDDNNMFPQPRKDTTDSLHYSHLLEKDQLTQQLEQGNTLHGLTEQPIQFPPTYKYKEDPHAPVLLDDDLDTWHWSSHRWPSWCDRILFSSTSTLKVKAGKYSALPIFRTSDHRPVALSATVPLQKVTRANFASLAPSSLDRTSRERRAAARRKELAVGISTYLGWTWEGNSVVLGTIVAILGAIWFARYFS